jgi:uncharacterized RDD family membrane protein YckC
MTTYKYQTFGLRVWAGFIDGLVLLPLGFLDSFVHSFFGAGLVAGLWYVFHSLSYYAYSVVLHGLYGQTVGKRIAGVWVRDITEGPLSFRQALLRDSVPIVLTIGAVILDLPKAFRGINPLEDTALDTASSFIGFTAIAWFGAEVVTMLWNNKRRAIHDFIAGSVVVREEGLSKVAGVSILSVNPDSIAEKAGMQKGDVIIEYDSERDLTMERLADIMAKRGGEPAQVSVVFVRDRLQYSRKLPAGPLGVSAVNTTVDVFY